MKQVISPSALLFLLLFLVSQVVKAQEPVWIKHVGSPTDLDFGNSLCQNADGNLMMVGTSRKPSVGVQNILLVKTDPDGNMIWSQVMSSGEYNLGYKVAATSDNYNIVAAITLYNVGEDLDAHALLQLSKTDVDGNPVWTKAYVNPSDYYFNFGGMIINRRGNIIVCGDVYRQTIRNYDLVLMEIKAEDGSVIWTKTIGGSGLDQGVSICQTGDDGYALTFTSNSFGTHSNRDRVVVKTSSSGNVLWAVQQESTSVREQNLFASGIAEAEGGNLIVSGDTYNTTASGFNYTLLKLSASGRLIWTRNYVAPQDNRTSGVLVNNYGNKGYVVYGHISPLVGVAPGQMYLLEVERSAGNVINATAVPRYGAASVINQPAGFFYSVASSTDAATGDQDLALSRVNRNLYTCGATVLTPSVIKTIIPKAIKVTSRNYTLKDSAVKLAVATMFDITERCSEKVISLVIKAGVSEPNILNSLTVYPSPLTGNKLFAKIRSGQDATVTVSIANTAGVIFSVRKENLLKGDNTLFFDVSKFGNGSYTMTISTAKEKKQAIFVKPR